MSKRIYDVSLTIYPGMTVWPGDPPIECDTVKSIEAGDSCNLSQLQIGTHAATHIDAPKHFIPKGNGVDSIEPEVLIGEARLFQLSDVHRIDRKLLESLDLEGVSRVLLGTRNSLLLRRDKLDTDYVFVAEDAAQYIVQRKIILIGVDYLSIEEYKKDGHPTHKTLLGAGVVIIEGLNLADVPPGDYELICLPLKIKDADGSPARVLLREI